MANRTVTVKSADGDYTSLAAAIAGEIAAAPDFAGDNAIVTVECYPMVDTGGAVLVDGASTSNSYYWNIVAAGGEASSAWDDGTGVYTLKVQSGDYALSLEDESCRVNGIQIEYSGNTGGRAIRVRGVGVNTNETYITNCFIKKSTGELGSTKGISLEDFNQEYYIGNCIVTGFNNTSDVGIECGNFHAWVYHCSVTDCTTGYVSGGDARTRLKNSRATLVTTVTTGSFHADSDYNFTTGTAIPGGNSLANGTSDYVDAGGGDFGLDVNDDGIDLCPSLAADSDWAFFTTDIKGTTRSTPDAGADEYTVTGTSPDLPVAAVTATSVNFSVAGVSLDVNLPVATATTDPGTSLGVQHVLDAISVAATAAGVSPGLGLSVQVSLPVASAGASPVNFSPEFPVDVNYVVASVGATAQTMVGQTVHGIALPFTTYFAVGVFEDLGGGKMEGRLKLDKKRPWWAGFIDV